MSIEDDLNLINQFLALHDYQENQHYDLILVLGSATPSVALKAYQLYRLGKADYFMIAGGKGHTTDLLIEKIENLIDVDCIQEKSEAFLLKKLIESVYQEDNSILLEETSTHCGENIVFAFRELQKNNIKVKKVLLCHDPLMQRRIDATAKKEFPKVAFYNYSAFIPEVKEERYRIVLKEKTWGQWPIERYLSILLGEMKRLIDDENGYGPHGQNYLIHVDIPENVMEAYHHIMLEYGHYLRT